VAPIPPDQNPLRHAWGLEDKFVVAYSGNLGRAHEFATVLGAAELLRDEPSIRFLMIGDGHHTKALRDEVQARRLNNFIFQPYQPPERLAQSLGAGDAHWVSLRPELEGLIVPSKVYGVLAAGRPIIAVTSADGEVAHLVSKFGCGVHVEPGDAEAFARAVSQLASAPGLAAQLGAAARAAAVGAFSRETSLAKWRRLLDDLDQAGVARSG
jgi:glycosyltransferase involved in cell wall biosynthesis